MCVCVSADKILVTVKIRVFAKIVTVGGGLQLFLADGQTDEGDISAFRSRYTKAHKNARCSVRDTLHAPRTQNPKL